MKAVRATVADVGRRLGIPLATATAAILASGAVNAAPTLKLQACFLFPGCTILITTPYRLLPNIVAEREVVPECVPHIGGASPIVKQASRYLLDSKNAAVQSEELHRICLRFSNHNPAEESARHIVDVIKKK